MQQVMSGLDLSRRQALKGGATLIVAAALPGGLVLGVNDAWSMATETLSPESFATLVQMSRDIYPHDRLEDRFYAVAVSDLDKAAKTDADVKAMLENGAAALDKQAGDKGSYIKLGSEEERLAILKTIEADAFFQKVRSNLVTGIYNNKEVWPIFGYEGESASKGGYIHRGFDDIGWL